MKTNTLIKSENFYVGFKTLPDFPAGWIFLNGNLFANFYTIKDWNPEWEGKIAFNRDMLAIDMGFPVMGPQESLGEILKQLEIFYVPILEKQLEEKVKEIFD